MQQLTDNAKLIWIPNFKKKKKHNLDHILVYQREDEEVTLGQIKMKNRKPSLLC